MNRSESLRPMLRVLLLAGANVGCAAVLAADEPRYGLGREASAEEIARIDIDVMPDGRGLPPGGATAAQGRVVYEQACAHCHGAEGRNGPNGSLAGEAVHDPGDLATDRSLKRTVGNYWPWATTLFDYVRRAMPYDRPGSLSDEEVYAVTAYVLFENGLIEENATVNAETLPAVQMPLQPLFAPASAWEAEP